MENVRNFCIIAHIDHGKSTLADRLLEETGTIAKDKMRPQFLDMMDLERERGITIKMQPVRMLWHPGGPERSEGQEFILNLIDTPGHVDFTYEVSRSLAAVEGAVLLVDATKGVQAQTVANWELAKNHNLKIIPAVNKIDSLQAKTEEVVMEISDLLNIDSSEILMISGKTGLNVGQVLEKVVEKVPAPSGSAENALRALIFDSKYDAFKGVIAYVRIFDGTVKKGDKIHLIGTSSDAEVKETGIFSPELKSIENLNPGEIGYIATGIKEPGRVRVGDTITFVAEKVQALPGYKMPDPMVFLSIFPANSDDFDDLKDGLEKLRLSDASLSFKPETKEGLGRGFQCGFLGLLHTEIVTERIKREFGLELVLSTPSVIYKIFLQDGKTLSIFTPSDWPDPSRIKETQELWAKLQILTPLAYIGKVLELIDNLGAKHLQTSHLGLDKAELIYEIPLRTIITKNLYDRLKNVSQGFASMNYEILDWRKADLVKLDILILGKKEEALSQIMPESEALREGRRQVEKLKEVLPSQLYAVALQAALGAKVIARETISAKRRDVIAPLYGGDYTRKRKLLEKQKKGKKELKAKGDIKISPSIFLEIFKNE